MARLRRRRADSRVIADDRIYDRDETRDVNVAPGLLGLRGAGRTWGTGLDRVYEVFDRESGERIARFADDDFTVYARGDAIVIASGDDGEVQRVVTRP